MEEHMERVLDIMNARALGHATNEQVEQVVAAVLQNSDANGTLTTPVQPLPLPFGTDQIQQQEKEVDKSFHGTAVEKVAVQPVSIAAPAREEENANERTHHPPTSTGALLAIGREKVSIELDEEEYDNLPAEEPECLEPPKPKKRGRGRPRKQPSTPETGLAAIDWVRYQEIPLGKQGAKMMTTFGDAKHPDPETVAATLLGARRMLQTAMQDARALRRTNKALYTSAQNSLRAYRPTKPTQQEHISSELLFRASEGYDQLSYDPKCGFDIEELRLLFPEEMSAYQRWNNMHDATATDAKNDVDEFASRTAELSHNDDNDEEEEVPNPQLAGGHLQERAAQFDLRTTQMPASWYLRFAEVRQGSFLPRRSGRDATWENARKQRKSKGAPRSGTWAHLSSVSVRFLHWLGFDPQSALPPPNEDATQALGFLGYDFFGRIVEKAIYLRNLARNEGHGVNILLELPDGEHLVPHDIDKAMEDSDIKPTPLYSSKEEKIGPQLYFGPGFESRLELEIEQLMAGGKRERKLTPEELLIRQEEDKLFEKLSAPPCNKGIASLIDDREEFESVPAKKRRI
ncbi:predicted protein [Phaeodactylum tricornutum CCAP 1055/1]|uniref:Uncharacterized protein n=1 Tax=Phaeodactylum tricornutum (strain CCAP 1055/1) TaxID=556484 RepID=B7FZI0_PHATC|nr:predicted protein [Phaeodactylum tricornutum CCAP 1055/1]EEC48545.1 predicted protein [Phaeodactylum tricornutum CCAP 1055/1]|eukprot:XP_002180354.1 predicted protein [Phaeodactylum tricornutum CCAP 1055/1]